MLVEGYGNDAGEILPPHTLGVISRYFAFISTKILEITALIDHHEVHLVLQSNPDGRKEAERGKTWRKNTNTSTVQELTIVVVT